MMQAHLEAIAEYVKKANGQVNFRVGEGELRESLLETALKEASGEFEDETSGDAELEVQLRLAQSGSGLSFRIVQSGGPRTPDCSLATLDQKAVENLAHNLAQLVDAGRFRSAPARAIIKRKGEPDAYDKTGASSRLKVSPEWLKSVIPCSNYSYDEIDGRKYIREYYWNVDLIENLFRLKNSKILPDDLKYVAEQCCFGDEEWAKDLIARLKSPNRPEPTPKEQSAKPMQKQNRPFSRDRMQARNRAKKPA